VARPNLIMKAALNVHHRRHSSFEMSSESSSHVLSDVGSLNIFRTRAKKKFSHILPVSDDDDDDDKAKKERYLLLKQHTYKMSVGTLQQGRSDSYEGNEIVKWTMAHEKISWDEAVQLIQAQMDYGLLKRVYKNAARSYLAAIESDVRAKKRKTFDHRKFYTVNKQLIFPYQLIVSLWKYDRGVASSTQRPDSQWWINPFVTLGIGCESYNSSVVLKRKFGASFNGEMAVFGVHEPNAEQLQVAVSSLHPFRTTRLGEQNVPICQFPLLTSQDQVKQLAPTKIKLNTRGFVKAKIYLMKQHLSDDRIDVHTDAFAALNNVQLKTFIHRTDGMEDSFNLNYFTRVSVSCVGGGTARTDLRKKQGGGSGSTIFNELIVNGKVREISKINDAARVAVYQKMKKGKEKLMGAAEIPIGEIALSEEDATTQVIDLKASVSTAIGSNFTVAHNKGTVTLKIWLELGVEDLLGPDVIDDGGWEAAAADVSLPPLPTLENSLVMDKQYPVEFRKLRRALLTRDSPFMERVFDERRLTEIEIGGWTCDKVDGVNVLARGENELEEQSDSSSSVRFAASERQVVDDAHIEQLLLTGDMGVPQTGVIVATRESSYIYPKSSIVAANKVVEYHTIELGRNSFNIKVKSHAFSVPFGDTFETLLNYRISATTSPPGDGGSKGSQKCSSITVTSAVSFFEGKRPGMLAGSIQRGVAKGTAEAVKAITTTLDDCLAGRGRSRRGRGRKRGVITKVAIGGLIVLIFAAFFLWLGWIEVDGSVNVHRPFLRELLSLAALGRGGI